MKRILAEGLLIGVIGFALSLAANAISPRGLKLTRNYFPDDRARAGTNVSAAAATNVVSASTNSAVPELERRLAAKGVVLVGSNAMIELFRDPRREQNLVAFIDARDDPQYKQGHVPAAYLLDYYRPENYLPTVLPMSQAAEQIVIYCNGGECEDSALAAGMLLDAGIPAQKLAVYGGGWHEWVTNGLPVEIGDRLSGIITNRVR